MISVLLADIPADPVRSSSYFAVWLGYFFLNLAIELGVLALLWKLRGRGAPFRPWLWAALVGNAVTHPVASLAWRAAAGTGGLALIGLYAAIELTVCAVEAVGYRKVGKLAWREAALVSFAANGVTALCGALQTWVF